MAWEAGRLGAPRRMALAQQVIAHRVLPQDPLAEPAAEPAWMASLLDPALPSPFASVDAVALI
jgi:acyl-CoA dehydrogenase